MGRSGNLFTNLLAKSITDTLKVVPLVNNIYSNRTIKSYLSADKPANKKSLCMREILVIEISLGQTASQAPVNVQLPKPSFSICATMLSTLFFFPVLPAAANQDE